MEGTTGKSKINGRKEATAVSAVRKLVRKLFFSGSMEGTAGESKINTPKEATATAAAVPPVRLLVSKLFFSGGLTTIYPSKR